MNAIMAPSRELRMYFLVMYNLSPIQQGIQAGHCVEEYADKYGQSDLYKEYRNFKTWVILNGGTSNSGEVVIWNTLYRGTEGENFAEKAYIDETKLGSMEMYEKYLIENGIPYASFHEPDLNNALSALCFICDEKVFDWKNYPSFQKLMLMDISEIDPESHIYKFLNSIDNLDDEDDMMKKYENFIGGHINLKLKELIEGKRLA